MVKRKKRTEIDLFGKEISESFLVDHLLPRCADMYRLYRKEGQTLDNIGKIYGVTTERVRQIVTKSERIIKKYLDCPRLSLDVKGKKYRILLRLLANEIYRDTNNCYLDISKFYHQYISSCWGLLELDYSLARQLHSPVRGLRFLLCRKPENCHKNTIGNVLNNSLGRDGFLRFPGDGSLHSKHHNLICVLDAVLEVALDKRHSNHY